VAADHSPMEQFAIKPLIPIHIGGLDLSFTNSALFMVIAAAVVTWLMIASFTGRSLVPGRIQSMAEMLYEFVANMVESVCGSEGRKYFPFIFTLFTFILLCNLLGLLPYAFTVTSHIVITVALALVVFIGVTIIGFARHGLGFLGLFAPHGVPMWIMPFLVPIEIFSYFVRPVSLSLRLFANMMAGHTMLKVIAGFVVMLGVWFGWLPFAFVVMLTAFEILVAVLQAYIFAILACVYLNDALHPGH
jgi:F-type H+-transporting ATPase subunit a